MIPSSKFTPLWSLNVGFSIVRYKYLRREFAIERISCYYKRKNTEKLNRNKHLLVLFLPVICKKKKKKKRRHFGDLIVKSLHLNFKVQANVLGLALKDFIQGQCVKVAGNTVTSRLWPCHKIRFLTNRWEKISPTGPLLVILSTFASETQSSEQICFCRHLFQGYNLLDSRFSR